MTTPDESEPFTFETFTVDVEFSTLDPDLINTLYGTTPTEPEFSVEIATPIKRTFWQWLLRRPPEGSLHLHS